MHYSCRAFLPARMALRRDFSRKDGERERNDTRRVGRHATQDLSAICVIPRLHSLPAFAAIFPFESPSIGTPQISRTVQNCSPTIEINNTTVRATTQRSPWASVYPLDPRRRRARWTRNWSFGPVAAEDNSPFVARSIPRCVFYERRGKGAFTTSEKTARSRRRCRRFARRKGTISIREKQRRPRKHA